MEGTPTPPAAPPPARSFGVFLGEIEDGRLHGDLTELPVFVGSPE